jgi:thiamine-phosphate pyrophosphorylase
MDLSERVAIFAQADLYVVITEEFCAGRPGLEVLERVLDAGVKVVQLREKRMNDKALYRRACEFREMTAGNHALLIIDDRVDIALASDADGVHLGQEDLPVRAALSLAPELVIGCSTHSRQEAVAAQEAGARYVNIGPIFATQTKSGLVDHLGPDAIDVIAPRLVIPWTVMGGIKESNIGQVLKRGAQHVAVVTAVTRAEDITAACASLRARIIAARRTTSLA